MNKPSPFYKLSSFFNFDWMRPAIVCNYTFVCLMILNKVIIIRKWLNYIFVLLLVDFKKSRAKVDNS